MALLEDDIHTRISTICDILIALTVMMMLACSAMVLLVELHVVLVIILTNGLAMIHV